MILTSLNSTDERIADKLRINPAFYLRHSSGIHCEKSGCTKNEGGLNNHDAYALAGNEVLDQLCRSLAAPRRHTSVIRDIWMLQLQFA